MGNFYVNHTVKTGDRDKVASVLRHNKLAAYVSPVRNGCVVVAEEQADSQATAPSSALPSCFQLRCKHPCLRC